MLDRPGLPALACGASHFVRSFPNGLFQPGGSYRFGLEALLLASYVLRRLENRNITARPLLELGCGCGATLLALASTRPELRLVGIEKQLPLVICGRLNCAAQNGVRILHADVQEDPVASLKRQCGLAFANPPWRLPGEGRPSHNSLRKDALEGPAPLLERFVFWARELLCNRGQFCLILPPRRLADILDLARKYHLGVREFLPVAPFVGQNATTVLLTLQKDTQSDPRILFPLVLHHRLGARIEWSQQALAYCPWLKNAS